MTKKKSKKPALWFEAPFDDFRKRRNDMTEMMREFWSPVIRMPEIRFPKMPKFIRIRMAETDEEILLRAELPGFSKDEIKLKITARRVFISADKKKKSIEQTEDMFRTESMFTSASRSLELPVEVNIKDTKAKLRDGVLEITLPKKEIRKKEEKEVRIE